MAANADAHFDPKVLSFLQDTSSIVPHRDSGSARALEKSGELGKHNVSMYIQLRMTMWTLLTLRGNMWGLLNRDQHAAGQPAIQAADRLPRPVPVKYNSGRNRATPFMIIDIPTAKAAVYYIIGAHLKGGPLRQLLERYEKDDKDLFWNRDLLVLIIHLRVTRIRAYLASAAGPPGAIYSSNRGLLEQHFVVRSS